MYTDAKYVLTQQIDPESGSKVRAISIRTEDGNLKRRLLEKLFDAKVVEDVPASLAYDLAVGIAKMFKNTESAELEVAKLIVPSEINNDKRFLELKDLVLARVNPATLENGRSIVLKVAGESQYYRLKLVSFLLMAYREYRKAVRATKRMAVFRQRERLADALWEALQKQHDLKQQLAECRQIYMELKHKLADSESAQQELRVQLAYEQGRNGRLEHDNSAFEARVDSLERRLRWKW